MQNRPARARSRLARLMDRPRAECNTIINFASPSDNPSLAVLAALLPAIGSPIRLANARAEIGAIDLDFALQLVAADHRSHSLAQFVQRDENRLGPTFMFRDICRAETPLTPLANSAITARPRGSRELPVCDHEIGCRLLQRICAGILNISTESASQPECRPCRSHDAGRTAHLRSRQSGKAKALENIKCLRVGRRTCAEPSLYRERPGCGRE